MSKKKQLYNSLKKLDFKRTLYWELKHGNYKLKRLYQFGMISPNVLRAVEVADTIYKECYKNAVPKATIEEQLANKYRISTHAIKQIWKGITQYIE